MNDENNINETLQNTCVAFGSFDGVHLGHRAVLAAVAAQAGYTPAVLCFAPQAEEKVLTTGAEKELLLKEQGMRAVVTCPYEAAQLPPEELVKTLLVQKMGARIVVAGEDVHFGKDGVGDAALLQALGEQYGFAVVLCPTVMADRQAVTAAAIKEKFAANNFAAAQALLGHPYIMLGTVEHGKAEGRRVGMPTANLGVPPQKLYPPYGVYATLSLFDGEKHRGMTNIGLRPSADTMPKATIETFVLDFSGDLYDKTYLLEVHAFIRPTVKFHNLAEVKQQVNRDIEEIRAYLEALEK